MDTYSIITSTPVEIDRTYFNLSGAIDYKAINVYYDNLFVNAIYLFVNSIYIHMSLKNECICKNDGDY